MTTLASEPGSSSGTSSSLSVIMFTDIVGSVNAKHDLGADAYSRLLDAHDRELKRIVAEYEKGEVQQDTGDGFLVTFATPSDAVNAALRFQHFLAIHNADPRPLDVRIGLHLGQVHELDRETGGRKIVGLPADVAARVMGLAQGRQILMTRAVFDEARVHVRQHPDADDANPPIIRWMAHGEYLFKGNEEPMEVFEVGGEGIASLKPPPASEKAQRFTEVEGDETLGWRPATGLEIPGRRGWLLDRRLGQGGFGEVWLGRNQRTREKRVFKFCFDAERLRSFKRELTLFRLLREALGDRHDIVRLHEVQLEAPPYYIESEFSPLGDMHAFADGLSGGIGSLPMEMRIDMVRRIAEAVSAAHSVGVLHKDIKPSNILMYDAGGEHPRPRLADFGIGVVEDASKLHEHQITQMGFTEVSMEHNQSSRTGTRMYAPPESLVGKAFTAQGDVFAMGVLLWQMCVGDLRRPMSHGWEAEIEDPVLREDIGACVAGEPDKRLGSASELAQRLKMLPERRKQHRRGKMLKFTLAASAVLGISAVVAASFAVQQRANAVEQERLKEIAIAEEAATAAALALAEDRLGDLRAFVHDFTIEFNDAIEMLEGSTPARAVLLDTSTEALHRLRAEIEQDPELDPEFLATVARGYQRVGELHAGARNSNLGETDKALPVYEHAVAVATNLVERTPEDHGAHAVLGSVHLRAGDLHLRTGDQAEALASYNESANAYQRMLERLREDESAGASTQREAARTLSAVQLKLADMHVRRGEVARARDIVRDAVAVRRTLLVGDLEKVERDRNTRSLAVALGRLGRFSSELGDADEARAALEENVDMRRELHEENPGTSRYPRDLAIALYYLSDFERAQGDAVKASRLAGESVTLIEEQVAIDPMDARMKRTLITMLQAQGEALIDLGSASEAVLALDRGANVGDGLLASDDTNLNLWLARAGVGLALAEALRDAGNEADALDATDEALAAFATVRELDPGFANPAYERALEEARTLKAQLTR